MRFAPLFQACLLLAALCGWTGAATADAALAASPAQGETFALQLASNGAQPLDANTGSVQFIGTATVIIRFKGFTILTDPNFLDKSEHVKLGYGLTSERKTNPAISFEDLPPIDLVVLSHFHDDHFDKKVQERLKRSTPIISTKEAGERLKRMGFTHTFGLSTWDRVDVAKGASRLRITATPGRHGPAAVAVLLPKTMGSVLEFGANTALPDYRIYISGDTLVHDDIGAIPQRFPNIDLALLHLGGTRLLGAVKVTMDGKDGVRMMQILRPRKTMPIHFNDYDVFESPLEEFAGEVKAAALEKDVVYLSHGQTYEFTPVQR